MNVSQKGGELQTLSPQQLFDVCYDSAGELVLSAATGNIDRHSTQMLGICEQAYLRSAYYWLHFYQPEPNASPLDKVRGYLEAFDRLCELGAWPAAAQILLTPLQFETEQALHEHLGTWGYYREQLNLYGLLLGKLNSQLDCLCLQGLGRASCLLGKVDEAINYHKRQLQLARELEDKRAEASALGGLGTVYGHIGQNKRAIAYHQQQLNLACEISDLREEIQALAEIGRSLCSLSRYRDAIQSFKEALDANDRLQDSKLESYILGQLGQTYCMFGNHPETIRILSHSLQVSEQLGRKNEICMALNTLGNSYCFLAQIDRAIECQQKSLRVASEMNYFFTQAIALNSLGVIYSYWLQNYPKALEYFEQAFEVYKKLGDRKRTAITLSSVSFCQAYCQNNEIAMENAQQALEIACELNDSHAKGVALSMVAHAYWHRGQYARGLLTVTKAMLINPPWKSANGKLMLRKTIEIVSQPLKKIWR